MFTMLFPGTDMRHLEAPPLLSSPILVCFEDRSGCSCVLSEGLSELTCDETVKGNDARDWEQLLSSVLLTHVKDAL